MMFEVNRPLAPCGGREAFRDAVVKPQSLMSTNASVNISGVSEDVFPPDKAEGSGQSGQGLGIFSFCWRVRLLKDYGSLGSGGRVCPEGKPC